MFQTYLLFLSGLKIPRMSLCCFRGYLLPVYHVMGLVYLASVSVGKAMAGGGRKTTKIGALRVQTNKSAAIYKLRLIFLS